MKYTTLIVILSLVCSMATNMNTLLQNKARAQDAVDAGLDVLKGLKQANVDAQNLADAANKTKEAEMAAEVSDLTALADSNKASGDAATEHRKYIEEQIDVTNQYLQWIIARRESLTAKQVELTEQRCVSGAAFIVALKEHDEALQVVAMLKQDVVGIVEEHTGETYEGLAQIEKLAAYTHLFNDQAMKAFAQLSQNNAAQSVDSETAEWDSNATDNTQAALSVDMGDYDAANRDVAHRFIDMINALEQHLKDSVIALERNEIQAAIDLSDWLQDTQGEHVWLNIEQEQNTIYIDKLIIAVVGAKSHEDKLWDIYFDSAMTLNDALAAREVVRQHYMDEKARRDEENIVLDDIIQMFIDQVSKLDSKIAAGATDYADDGSFNQSTGSDYTLDNVDAMQGAANNDMNAANAAANAAPYF